MNEDWERDDLPEVDQLRAELERVQRRGSTWHTVRTVVITAVVLAVIAAAALIWTPVHQVAGQAMTGTLEDGDVVIALRAGEAKPGELILFRAPDGSRLVRRVIAVTGDEVNILEDGTVLVNGVALEEEYVTNPMRGEGDFPLPYVVPSNRYFVLADDRSDELDSRMMAVGSVKAEQVLGRVALRIWPLSELTSFMAD